MKYAHAAMARLTAGVRTFSYPAQPASALTPEREE